MSDFGRKMREARERRGVSLRQIAATTKISIAALEALERNDPSRLPGGIFTRAIVRSYASEVGLDPNTTVREFLTYFDLDLPSLTRETPAGASDSGSIRGERRLRRVLLKVVVVSLVLAAIILYLAFVRAPERSAMPPSADNARRTARRLVSASAHLVHQRR